MNVDLGLLTYNSHDNQQQVLNNLHQMIGSMINTNTHVQTEKINSEDVIADCTINADIIQLPNTVARQPIQHYATRPCCTTINLNSPLISPPIPVQPKLVDNICEDGAYYTNHENKKHFKSNQKINEKEPCTDNDTHDACFGKEEYLDQLFGFTNSNEFFNDLTDMT